MQQSMQAYGNALGGAQSVIYLHVSEKTFCALRNLPEFAPGVASDNGEEHIEVSNGSTSLYVYHAPADPLLPGVETT